MIPSIEWTEDNKVKMIDQTILPHELKFLEFTDYRDVATSIKVMNIRGAPAIGVAAAMMADPEIIVLDEPFNGLDPSSQIRLINMLNDLRKVKQTTLLVSSHDLNHVTEVCGRIAILEKGLIVKDLATSATTLKELQSYFSV